MSFHWKCYGIGERDYKEKVTFVSSLQRVPGYGSMSQAAQLHFDFFLSLSASFLATHVRKKSRWQCVLKERGLMWSPTPGNFHYPAPVFDNHLFFPIHVDAWLLIYISGVVWISVQRYYILLLKLSQLLLLRGLSIHVLCFCVCVCKCMCVCVHKCVCISLSSSLSLPPLLPSPALCAHVYVGINMFVHMKP